ncbi:hypothetical protein N0V84_008330 [Fusarium piperis]|uniref:MARVEL domain-containing protein n=1 Tax=Fusarium piperis TaxID=1435070 RepID=A0A9W8W886_9HYPO|nr:hypothetical protein N0V84_008330 [Fusarium piperis]
MARSNVSLGLLLVELALALMAILLFGVAYPDRFRWGLWENGGEEGWNSNPNDRIYSYANYREAPEVPLIWQRRLAQSNFAVAILSLVICVARVPLSYLGSISRYISAFYDALLLCFWAMSLTNQASGDFSDPEHPSPRPWYLTHECSAAWQRNQGYCRIAQASFAVSVLAAVLYGVRLLREALLVAYDMGRKHEQRLSVRDVDEEMGEKYTDNEHETAVCLTVQRGSWQDQALSPVLAFFPSGYDG